MNRIFTLPALLLLAALVAPRAGAVETVTYAEEDGTIKTSPVAIVRKDSEKEFNARILVAGRRRTLKIPARQVVSFDRGDNEAKNQWSRSLARGKRLMAANQLATVGTVAGAEEVFTKVAYSTEKGTKGQEETEEIAPWHNMYALFYLIQTRYELGQQGKEDRYAPALANVAEFKKRTDTKSGRLIDWEVPAEKGTTRPAKIYGWGDSRLLWDVRLYEARIHSGMKAADPARAAYTELIADLKKGGSPILLAQAILELAELEATGKPSDQQETVIRKAGNELSALANGQPDAFGKSVLRREANQAFLRGADLLLQSAEQKTVGWDTPRQRYLQLRDGEGKRDAALFMGAQAGIGICLVEMGEGRKAYEALLDVALKGHRFPDQMARALYYLGRAAPLYAGEIESAGGKADFLKAEKERWWSDLQERYPGSKWAEKAKG